MVKGGIVVDGPAGAGGSISALHPSVLRAHLDASLRALGLDDVDAYLLHYPDETGVPVEVSWEAVTGLVAEGRARRAGLGRCRYFPLGAITHFRNKAPTPHDRKALQRRGLHHFGRTHYRWSRFASTRLLFEVLYRLARAS